VQANARALMFTADLIDRVDLLGPHHPRFCYYKLAENELSTERLLGIGNIVATLFVAQQDVAVETVVAALVDLFDREEDKQAVSILVNWFHQMITHGRVDLPDQAALATTLRSKEEVAPRWGESVWNTTAAKCAKDTKGATFVSFAHFAAFAFQAPARPPIRPILPIRALSCPSQIQRQQPRRDLLIRQILRPAVGGEDCRIQPAMRGGEPIRPRVVEVGERALLQFLFRQVGRVEPGVALALLSGAFGGADCLNLGDQVGQIWLIKSDPRRRDAIVLDVWRRMLVMWMGALQLGYVGMRHRVIPPKLYIVLVYLVGVLEDTLGEKINLLKDV
jgi:hypothetical protein